MDIGDLNRAAWDHAVNAGDNPYTQVVTSEQVAAARTGEFSLYLSDGRPVPPAWVTRVSGLRVLCLASGGGQQAPIFAALGAEVTLLDASVEQLAQDRYVAERDGLAFTIIEGDMADLSALADDAFDLIFNPPSTMFVPHLQPVWQECNRVLRPGGTLMTGFINPDEFVFDADALDNEGAFVVRHSLPYVEYDTLVAAEREERRQAKAMFHFSHTMESQLGGILDAGFVITGFYEDRRTEADGNRIRHYLPSFFVVRAHKGAIV